MLIARAVLFATRIKPIKHLRRLHRKAFDKKYLLITNISLSFGLSITGDLIEQRYEIYRHELEEYNILRTAHMGLSGVGVGIICHYWYLLLEKRMPSRTINAVIKKIVLDQLICSPLYISLFFITMGILENDSPSVVWAEMKRKAWKLYIADCMIWPLAQFVNFYWIPYKYRVLYDNTVSLGYDIYSSRLRFRE